MLETSVQRTVDEYLHLVDARLPGRIEGLYLIGSVSLGDFRPGTSDIDFVAVTPAPLSGPQLADLGRAHSGLRRSIRRPAMEGAYMTWEQLRRPPGEATGVANVHGRRLTPDDRFIANPVTWLNLAAAGIPVRGATPSTLGVWIDQAELREWTLGNLRAYWLPLAQAARRPGRRALASLSAKGIAWGVLGVVRLHYTLATGAIVSKSAAYDYAVDAFDARWRRILAEALRVRTAAAEPSTYREPLSRRRDALAFMSMVVDDADRRLAPRRVRSAQPVG